MMIDFIIKLVICQGYLDIRSIGLCAIVSTPWKKYAYHPMSIGWAIDGAQFSSRVRGEDIVRFVEKKRILMNSRHRIKFIDLQLIPGVECAITKLAEELRGFSVSNISSLLMLC